MKNKLIFVCFLIMLSSCNNRNEGIMTESIQPVTTEKISESYQESVILETMEDIQSVNTSETATSTDLSDPSRSYKMYTESYKENESFIAYPQIEGLLDPQKQDQINALLKESAFFSTKSRLYYEPYIDFNDETFYYEESYSVGFANEYIASFNYTVRKSVRSTIKNEEEILGWRGWGYGVWCITIDMTTGEEIRLSDLMELDERFFKTTDGVYEPVDYSTVTPLVYHSMQDMLEVYLTEEERDSNHWYSMEDMIDKLQDPESQAIWYIKQDGSFQFEYTDQFIIIPYIQFKDLIYPKYREMLESS